MCRPLKVAFLCWMLITSWYGLAGANPYHLGDINGDHNVDFKDLQILALQWLDPACLIPGCEADLDGTN